MLSIAMVEKYFNFTIQSIQIDGDGEFKPLSFQLDK